MGCCCFQNFDTYFIHAGATILPSFNTATCTLLLSSLDFLSATDVRQRVGMKSAEEDAMSEASEFELREREEKTEERNEG